MITLEQVRKAISKHCMVWDEDEAIAEVDPGKIRIETRFKYPDGGSIELYLVQAVQQSLPEVREAPRLSDLGETMTWLFHAQVKPWTSEKRRSFVRDVLELYEVDQVGGELVRTVAGIDDLGDGIIRLGQACLRVSDLVFTKRMTITSSTVEQVEAVLDDAEFTYARDIEIPGRFKRPVRMDFVVSRQEAPTAGILTLSSSTTKWTAHTMANEVFAKWYDIQDSPLISRRVTVYDDRQEHRHEDLERLEEVSDIVGLSDSRRLVSLLEEAA